MTPWAPFLWGAAVFGAAAGILAGGTAVRIGAGLLLGVFVTWRRALGISAAVALGWGMVLTAGAATAPSFLPDIPWAVAAACALAAVVVASAVCSILVVDGAGKPIGFACGSGLGLVLTLLAGAALALLTLAAAAVVIFIATLAAKP